MRTKFTQGMWYMVHPMVVLPEEGNGSPDGFMTHAHLCSSKTFELGHTTSHPVGFSSRSTGISSVLPV